MRIRPYISNLDFDEIRNWITDELTHSFWCANRFQYPLVQEDFENKLSEMKLKYGETPFVATTDEGKAVGFFCYSLNLFSNEGMLKFIMVSPECRGKGYGCEMVSLAVKYAFEMTKADMVQLNVFSNNIRAIKCYLNVGFWERSITDNAFRFNNEMWKRCNMVIRKNRFNRNMEVLQMAVKILEIKREHCPAARFIGKKYEGSANWNEWWENDWFAALEANPRIPFNGDAYIGAVHIVNGMPERWIGMLFPTNTEVPKDFEYVDTEPLDYAVCYLYDKEGSDKFYSMDTHKLCLEALKAHNLKRKEDDWCFERYNCPRFTTPDEKGNVILDYAISIES